MITEASFASLKYRNEHIDVFFEEYSTRISLFALRSRVGFTYSNLNRRRRHQSRFNLQFSQKPCPCQRFWRRSDSKTRQAFPEDWPANPCRIKESCFRVSKEFSRGRALYEQDATQFSTFSMASCHSIKMHSEIYEPAGALFDPILNDPVIFPLFFRQHLPHRSNNPKSNYRASCSFRWNSTLKY